jgi:hypothetical protein
MQFAFDLISDLHVETWENPLDFGGFATSPYALIVGDVARDRDVLRSTLQSISQQYQTVFYIDGNDEHSDRYNHLGNSYHDLEHLISGLENVVYLQNNLVIINGIAILATNGWWTYDFDPTIDAAQTKKWWQEKVRIKQGVIVSDAAVDSISLIAVADAVYMTSSLAKLQTYIDVKHVIMATHTVPRLDLISHDIDIDGTYFLNCFGNRYMSECIECDHTRKISTWCFGHYHNPVDIMRDGIRYVNNCRGRGDSAFSKFVYHPKRIEIDY